MCPDIGQPRKLIHLPDSPVERTRLGIARNLRARVEMDWRKRLPEYPLKVLFDRRIGHVANLMLAAFYEGFEEGRNYERKQPKNLIHFSGTELAVIGWLMRNPNLHTEALCRRLADSSYSLPKTKWAKRLRQAAAELDDASTEAKPNNSRVSEWVVWIDHVDVASLRKGVEVYFSRLRAHAKRLNQLKTLKGIVHSQKKQSSKEGE